MLTSVASGSEAYKKFREDRRDSNAPSRSAKKRASESVQLLGAKLIDAPRDLLAELPLPAVAGHFAYGYLQLESGHHRFRGRQDNSVIRVRVLPWQDATAEVTYFAQRALKKVGLMGGRVRSRLQVAGSGLVFQNERTLAENRSIAGSIVASYINETRDDEAEVRRYDSDPCLLKDHLTGSTGRADALSPDRFHDLLCRRVEATYEASNSDC